MAVTKNQNPDYLPKTKANNQRIVELIEAKKGPVGKGHHNSHRTAAIMRWLDKQESKKSGSNDNGDSGGSSGRDITGGFKSGKTESGGIPRIAPKGTPDINLGQDVTSRTTRERMPIIGRKKPNAAAGPNPNIHLPVGRAMSPREAKYYKYLQAHINDPGGKAHMQAFLSTLHESNA